MTGLEFVLTILTSVSFFFAVLFFFNFVFTSAELKALRQNIEQNERDEAVLDEAKAYARSLVERAHEFENHHFQK